MKRGGLLIAGICVAGAIAAGPAEAATFKVTRTADTTPNGCSQGGCTLREAVLAANQRPGGDVIELRGGKNYAMAPGGTFEDEAADGDFDLLGPTTVRGVKGRATVTANGEFTEKVFEVLGPRAKFVRVKMTNGHANLGGAIEAGFGSDLTLIRCAITDSRAGAAGGAIAAADGPDDSLRIVRSRLAGNSGAGLFWGGGAVYIDGGSATIVRSRIVGNDTELGGSNQGSGGAILVGSGEMTISRSWIRGNKSDELGGAILVQLGEVLLRQTTVDRNVAGTDGGGVASSGGTTTYRDSTVSRNESGGSGGGIFAEESAQVRLTNSTVALNRALFSGGGIRIDGPGASATLNAATVARNVANYTQLSSNSGGGGVNSNNGATFAVANSLIALNRAPGGVNPDCYANLGSEGNNVLTNTAGCSGLAGSDDDVGNPRIGRLKGNGGPTETIALKRGSPAVGHAGNDAPARDQRERKRDGDPDSGAFER